MHSTRSNTLHTNTRDLAHKCFYCPANLAVCVLNAKCCAQKNYGSSKSKEKMEQCDALKVAHLKVQEVGQANEMSEKGRKCERKMKRREKLYDGENLESCSIHC